MAFIPAHVIFQHILVDLLANMKTTRDRDHAFHVATALGKESYKEFQNKCGDNCDDIRVGDVYIHRHFHFTPNTLPFSFYVSWLIVTKVTRKYIHLSYLLDKRFVQDNYLFSYPLLDEGIGPHEMLFSVKIKRPSALMAQSKYITPYASYTRVKKEHLDAYHAIEVCDTL